MLSAEAQWDNTSVEEMIIDLQTILMRGEMKLLNIQVASEYDGVYNLPGPYGYIKIIETNNAPTYNV
jgi:hypothetical protein